MKNLQSALEVCRQLPKTDLHVHLDGSVRPETLLELASGYDEYTTWTLESITHKMRVDKDCRSLADYLERFGFVNRYLQGPEAIERVASELVEDAAEDNVKYIEARFCPSIHTVSGATPESIVEAALAGLKKGSEKTGTRSALILCAMREQEPKTSMALAELAVTYRNSGVVAFDLAGDESKPAKPHYPAFDHVGSIGIPRIAHAGEAAGPENIKEAVDKLGAERIGHGTRLLGDLDLLNEIAERGIPLEVCPTSNVQTRAVSNYDGHPFARYLRSGVKITINTDNRSVSGTSASHELARAWVHGELTVDEVKGICIAGVDAAFLPADDKAQLKEVFQDALTTLFSEVTA